MLDQSESKQGKIYNFNLIIRLRHSILFAHVLFR